MSISEFHQISAYIDFSIYTENQSIGVISGQVSFLEIPNVGDSFILVSKESGVFLPSGYVLHLACFVERKRKMKYKTSQFALGITDVNFSDVQDAVFAAKYLEKTLHLYFDSDVSKERS